MSASRWSIWALYLGLWAVATWIFSHVTDNPDVRIAHGALTYLILIIGASRQGGRTLSMTMVALSYLAVDWFFVPPRFAFGGATQLNWLILFGFIITGLLISQLFAQLQRAVRVAHDRTLEVERLSAERLQLEREASTARALREADRLKNALLNSIAHDLRSPVATLALVADPVAGFAHETALSRVRDEARRLGEFIGTLQRFATADGGGALSIQPHDADALVQTALRSSEALLTKRRVRIDAPQATVQCDLTLSVQVLGNLLQNAARYAPAHEPIDVFVRIVTDDDAAPHRDHHDEAVEIVVADRGPGLAEADVERIFTPLRRRPADRPTDDESGEARMGMGLSIARTFARAQRGDVRYRARAGGGSEFVLRLPRGDAPSAP